MSWSNTVIFFKIFIIHVKVEDLDMLARLKLAREKEEDCMESLVDGGEAEDAEDEELEESSEVSSRY